MIIELHAVQSFAPANLNRDDTGAPKECTFGGVRRARVSSQSWKRAMRVAFRDAADDIAVGTRTKRAHREIVTRMKAADPSMSREDAEHRAAVVLEAEPLGLSLKVADEAATVKTGQLIFFRPGDLDRLADIARDCAAELDELPSSLTTEGKSPKKDGKAQKKVKLSKDAAAHVKLAMTTAGDALDVALFGRMIAEIPEGNVDAACQVAHAIGTHRLASEFDYYTAVDDLKPDDTEGADMIGTVQFNASCLYRYMTLDVTQLATNLGNPDDSLLGAAVAAAARAFVTSIPTGKQNTFAAHNLPTAVLGVRRSIGAWNLANAFLAPVDARSAHDGVALESTRRMVGEFESLAKIYASPDDAIDTILLLAGDVDTAIARSDHLDELLAWLAERGFMSTTLRIWLSAPLQSWGTASRFEARTTDLAPSKSGVVGLLCAALGRHRGEPVDDLAALRFGVRVETPGSVLRDFHTVGAGRDASGIAVASGARSQARGVVTQRYYLQDAAFVAGLRGDDPELLSQLRDAVARPRWPLALGRRSCPPAGPLVDADALVAEPLEVALARHWCPAGAPDGLLGTGEDVELLIEDAKGALELQDAPLGAAFRNRTFAVRRVRSRWVTGDREVV